MKVIWILVSFIFLFNFAPNKCRKVLRIRRIKCETSGTTAKVNFCRLKTFKRRSYHSSSVTYNRTPKDVKLSILYKRKMQSEKLETFLKMENIEFCPVLKNNSLVQYIPVVGSAIYYLSQFGNLIDICMERSNNPFNVTLSNVTWDTFEPLQLLPKGEYEFNYQWFDFLDKNVLFSQIYGNII